MGHLKGEMKITVSEILARKLFWFEAGKDYEVKSDQHHQSRHLSEALSFA